MDLYLHIGTEKTGTTSIQSFMEANRRLLKRNRILYPRAPGEQNHRGLAAMAQTEGRGELWQLHGIGNLEERDAYRRKLQVTLAEELEQRRFRTVIMSNEHCSSRLLEDGEVDTLRAFLAKFFSRVRIVLYIRRQDDFLLSTYSTGVKLGQTEALRLPRQPRIEARYDYALLLDRWSRAFGRENIICRKFEKASLVSGNLLSDFLAVTGCDPDLPWERPGTLNSSLDAKCLEFLRLLNLRGIPEGRPRLKAALERISDGPLLDLPEGERSRFMQMMRESNRQVAREYFGGELSGSDDPVFAPRADIRARTCEREITLEQGIAIAARLLSLENVKGRQRDRPVAFGHGESSPVTSTVEA